MVRHLQQRRRWHVLWLVTIPLLFLLVWLMAPVGRLLWQGMAGAPLLGVPELSHSAWWLDPHLRFRVGWTVLQALITCAICAVLGMPMAWLLARRRFWGRTLWQNALALPFVVPTLVAAMGILALWGPRGWLGPVLAQADVNLQGTSVLLLLGNLFFIVGVVVRAGIDGVGEVSAARLAAARTVGGRTWRAFWRIEWPVMRPWICAALCLVFLYCFTGFGLALVLGGQAWATVEVEIYTLIAHELALGAAARLAVAMLALTAGVALAYAWVEKRLAVASRVTPVATPGLRGPTDWTIWAVALLTWLLLCGAPLLALCFKGLQAAIGQGAAVLQDEETGLALFNTLRFCAFALMLATAVGVLHAAAGQALRGRSWLAWLWRASAYAPLVVSPVALAFGFLLLYPTWLDSWPLLVTAYALLAFPFVAQSQCHALDAMPVQYSQAAATAIAAT